MAQRLGKKMLIRTAELKNHCRWHYFSCFFRHPAVSGQFKRQTIFIAATTLNFQISPEFQCLLISAGPCPLLVCLFLHNDSSLLMLKPLTAYGVQGYLCLSLCSLWWICFCFVTISIFCGLLRCKIQLNSNINQCSVLIQYIYSFSTCEESYLDSDLI